MMKTFIRAGLTCIAFAVFGSGGLAASSYEASTLLNAVKRSETVQDLFLARWDIIQEKELYFDWFGKINWVEDFKVNTVNAGSGLMETVPVTLVRTYGSITINYPIVGGYDGIDIKDRLTGKGKKKKEDEERGTGLYGLWNPRNLILGFTTTGFHYGLTREVSIDRGAAGSETVTDYKFDQFFDDLFALSALYMPYFYVHAGVIVNNQIEQSDDGTMDYTDATNKSLRFFMATNILSFLGINMVSTEESLESLSVGIKVNGVVDMFGGALPPLVPEITVTYKKLRLYNDEPYDAVWVRSAFVEGTTVPKGPGMSDGQKDGAVLNTLSFLAKENLFYRLYIDVYVEFQRPSAPLVDKRTVTASDPGGDELDVSALREIYGAVGYNFLGTKARDGYLLLLSLGVSRFWDPAIPVFREEGTGYHLHGMFVSASFTSPFAGLDFRVIRNYSPELRRLVETADKLALEGSAYICL